MRAAVRGSTPGSSPGRRTTILGALALLPLLAAAPVAIAAGTAPTVRPVAAGIVVEIVTPGRLLDVAWTSSGDGDGDGAPVAAVFALVAPERDPDGPRRLYRWRPPAASAGTGGAGSAGDWRALDGDLPAQAESLAGHRGTLLLGLPDRAMRLEIAALGEGEARVRATPLWQAAGLDLHARPRLDALEAAAAGHAPLALAAVGKLAIFEALDRPPVEIALPLAARRGRTGLVLATPRIAALPRPDAPPLYAVGPEPAGGTRLRTVLIDPEAAGEARYREIFSRLPGAETVLHHRYVMQDGRPRLLVSTVGADKMVILGRQRLRSFPLLADRTRSGKASSIDAEISARRWQGVAFAVGDLDGDGNDDLTVIAPDGLGGGKLVVEVYAGKGSGRYALRPRRTKIDRRLVSRRWGGDLDGDGESDLLARDGTTLALYPGKLRGAKKGAVAAAPAWTVELGAEPAAGDEMAGDELSRAEVEVGASGLEAHGPERAYWAAPRLADLDGDGDLDVLLTVRNQRGRGRLAAILLDPGG